MVDTLAIIVEPLAGAINTGAAAGTPDVVNVHAVDQGPAPAEFFPLAFHICAPTVPDVKV